LSHDTCHSGEDTPDPFDTDESESDDDSVEVLMVCPSPKLEIVSCGLTKCQNGVPLNFVDYWVLVKMNSKLKLSGARKLPRFKRIILEHGLSLSEVLSNVYLDYGCKFIAIPGPKGYWNFAILDQNEFDQLLGSTWLEEFQAQEKYVDLLQHISPERHITWTIDNEGNYHFYPFHRNKRTDLEMRKSVHRRKACVQGTSLIVGENHVKWTNMQFSFFNHFTFWD